MQKSSKSRRSRKAKSHQAAKPYPGFPLTVHPTGRWCKKHNGRQHYFGPVDDWQGALERYNREWPYIIQGKTPPPVDTGDGLKIANLCDEFLNSKGRLLETGEIASRTFRDYYVSCERLVNGFGGATRVDGLTPVDFERLRASLAERIGPVTLANEIGRIRVIFNYAFDSALIERPIRYGQGFRKPSKKVLRHARNAAGPRMFEAEELRRLLKAAESNPVLGAMILLGVNCGFGQSDVANLPLSAVNLTTDWIDFPRPKTGIERRCPLWQETAEALRAAIQKRPEAGDEADNDLCFITKYGRRWVRTNAKGMSIDAVSQEMRKLMTSVSINGNRGFYALRHTFETIGGESKDQVAVNAIMGHVDNSMAGVYRERINDERLQAVVETVRVWLWR